MEAVASAASLQNLHGHVPAAATQLTPLGQLDSSKRLSLAIGLPLRNQAELDQFLKELADPQNPNYRRYLTPAEFAEKFGPSEKDYEEVAAFAAAHGFTIKARHPNRVILDVSANVADIEKTLHTKIRVYRHPSESRDFYAPDAEPSLDLPVQISHIGGLDTYSIPHPNLHLKPATVTPNATQNAGTGPNGAYAGPDFRAAYVPGTTLTGSGQSVALLQFDGFYASDIAAYKTQFGLPDVPVVTISVDGGVSTPGTGNSEVCLDIEMVLSMAPGISAVYVYEAPNPSPWVDLLSKIANDNLAKQVSCSWGGGSTNAAAEAIFQQMAAQGQTFFNATGDSDAFTGTIPFPSDSPNITEVGATTLTTTGAGGSYVSETVWNWGNGVGSSGGSSTVYAIPSWQQAVNMAQNQGSTTMRNVPDVALVGDNVYVKYNNGSSGNFGGTSCAAPLWAAFTALVNQRAAVNGKSPVGFLNPAIYSLGLSGSFSSEFHDTTTGNNYSSSSTAKFCAVTGYDLCTGWGTPMGSALIDALGGSGAPVITSGSSLPPGEIGMAYSSQLGVQGGASPYSWGIAGGALPSGLSLDLNSGALSGTPVTVGTANFTVQVTDLKGLTSTADFNLVVYPAGTPIITTGTVPCGTVGVLYTGTLPAAGGSAPYAWSVVSGTLPAGLSLSSGGVIGGTPTTAGLSNFTLQIAGADGASSMAALCMTINPPPPPPVITTSGTLPAALMSTPYQQTLAVSGGTPPYLWSYYSGNLPPGLHLDNSGVISGTALTMGTFNFKVAVADTGGASVTKAFTLAVSAPPLYSFSLNTDPNWTRQGQWAFGHPQGAGGGSWGYPDPTAGATGTNVFGVNLAGNYSTTIGGPYYLIAGPLNFANCSGVKLQFQRWLNTDYQPFVAETIDVSTTGTTWTKVYANPTGTFVWDSKWTQVQYDISSVADKQSSVYVRWGYSIAQSGAYACSGWNIDDIQFLGVGTGPLKLSLSAPTSISEGSSMISCGVSLGTSASTAVTVSLASSDSTVVSVPSTVTIPAGLLGTTFQALVSYNQGLTGTRNATITASAEGYPGQSKTIVVMDAQKAALQLLLPPSVKEGGPVVTGTVTMSSPATTDVTVTLQNCYAPQVTAGNAIIKAGQTSGVFAIQAVDDQTIDGDTEVVLVAHVDNWTDGQATMQVLDNETRTLAFQVPAAVQEGDSPKIGYVKIPGTLNSGLVVSIASDNTDKIIVPATATISAGQTSGTFGITIVDNTIGDGAQTVTLTASAANFTGTTAQIVVADNEVDHFVLSAISSPQIRNAPFSVSVTACTIDNTAVTNYSGTVALSGSGAGGPVVVRPTSASGFVNGVWTGNVTAGGFDNVVTLVADDGAGHTGTSNTFAVTTGSLDHFAFAAIPSPQTAATPFAITVFAQDSGGNTVADFNGTISLVSTLPVSPAATGNFVSGVWSGNVSMAQPCAAVVLSGSDGAGHSGTSNAFDVTTSANMMVTPASGISVTGTVGGSFAPSSFTYTVSNAGTGWMDWTVSGSSAWLGYSTAGGSLASGSSVTVTVTVNGVPSTLPIGNYSDIVSFTNLTAGFGSTTRAAALKVLPPQPVITSTLAATIPNGAAFAYQIVASNDPTSYGASGLPAGLGVNTATGLISGTTIATGTSSVTLSACNAGGTGNATLMLTVLPPPPVISSTLTQTGTCGVAFSYQIAATNNPTSFDAGGLPGGIGIDTATGLISGTPTTIGTSSIALAASNAGGVGSAIMSLTVVPLPPPVINSTNMATGALGVAFNYQITAINSPARYGATGLPASLTVDPGTGLISGSLTQIGSFSTTIQAANSSGTGSALLTINTLPVAVWGDNSENQRNVPAGLTDVVAVAGGGWHSLALKSDGTVVGWGMSSAGQCTPPAGLTNVVAVAAGGYHSIALKADGTVVAWGWNVNGQTNVPAGLNHVVAIASGFEHNLALKSDGTVVAWGWNYYGQTAVPPGLRNVVAIAAGEERCTALRADGTVVAWGDDSNVPTDLGRVVAISGGCFHTMALTSDGAMRIWGDTSLSNLPAGLDNVLGMAGGNGHCLAIKPDRTVVAWGYGYYGETTVPPGLGNAAAVSAGYLHSLAISKYDFTTPNPVIINPKMAMAGAQYPFQYRIIAKNSPSSYGAYGLPSGLSLNAATGIITGTPAQSGTFNITISANNASGSGSSGIVLTVLPPPAPVITSTAAASGTSGVPFSYQIAATYLPTGYTATSLPTGLTVNPLSGLISGKPSQSGTFNSTIGAVNAGGTGTALLAISIGSPLGDWKNKVFTPAEMADSSVSGDMACPAHDGIPNLIKYALHLNPKTYAAPGMPLAVPAQISGTRYLTLTFTQVISASDISYIPEVSGDLQMWNSGDGYTKVVNVTNNADGETQSITVQDENPLNESVSRRFIRLKITKP